MGGTASLNRVLKQTGLTSNALGQELIDAARAEDTAQVQKLLAAKAPVDYTDKFGRTALIAASQCPNMAGASQYGHIAPVEVLLVAKANVDLTEQRGRTALVYASRNNLNIGLAELLESWPQLTPLMLAVVLQRPHEIK